MKSYSIEKRWVFPVVLSSLVCVFIIVTSFNVALISSFHTINSLFSIMPSRAAHNQTNPSFVEDRMGHVPSPPGRSTVPWFAYLVSGSKGDLEKLWRALKALYHPLNQYIVHLDLESLAEERLELASHVEKEPLFATVGKNFMITKANMGTCQGPTMVTNTLHACVIILRQNKDGICLQISVHQTICWSW